MKNLILGLALCGLAFGCKTDKQAAISDASGAPATECAASGADCCATKSACSEAEKAECASKKTCPVTGKVSE